MDRYLEQHLEEYLTGKMETGRQVEFQDRLEKSDEYTRQLVDQFQSQGSLLRETCGGLGDCEPTPGFYSRVLQRIETQRVGAWWSAFLMPEFIASCRCLPHVVRFNDEIIELSRREFSLLEELLSSTGRVLSRSQLEEKLYSWGDEIESNAIEVHIHHLRKRFGTDLIKTVRGVGYIIHKA